MWAESDLYFPILNFSKYSKSFFFVWLRKKQLLILKANYESVKLNWLIQERKCYCLFAFESSAEDHSLIVRQMSKGLVYFNEWNSIGTQFFANKKSRWLFLFVFILVEGSRSCYFVNPPAFFLSFKGNFKMVEVVRLNQPKFYKQRLFGFLTHHTSTSCTIKTSKVDGRYRSTLKVFGEDQTFTGVHDTIRDAEIVACTMYINRSVVNQEMTW
jgi:hypothetical protein